MLQGFRNEYLSRDSSLEARHLRHLFATGKNKLQSSDLHLIAGPDPERHRRISEVLIAKRANLS